jgi:hypothetical protein
MYRLERVWIGDPMPEITVIFPADQIIAKQLLLNRTCNNCFFNLVDKCSFDPVPWSDRGAKSLPKNNTCMSWTE